MPIYVYNCPEGHQIEEIFSTYESSPQAIPCPWHDAVAERGVGRPCFKLSWVPTMIDSAKEAWAGTPLEGTDGINPLHYKSEKIQVDLGTKPQQSGKSKERKGMRAVLAGDAA
jgi:hypothetical protein